MSPRAWRWNSDTPSSCSSAETCRDTADCDRPSCSPACVKLPAWAAAWKTLSLSQSMMPLRATEFPARIHSLSVVGEARPQPLLGRCPVFRPVFRFRSMFRLGRQEAFGFERSHAALSGRRYRLTVDIVRDVAGGEYARY